MERNAEFLLKDESEVVLFWVLIIREIMFNSFNFVYINLDMCV